MTVAMQVPVTDVGLGLAVLAAAAFTLLAEARATQAMGFLVLGALISVVWLRLGSVDIALAEAALGGGILGALLIWLAVAGPERSDGHRRLGAEPPPRFCLRLTIGLVTAALTAVAAAVVWAREADTVPGWLEPLAQQLPELGVSHEVTAVLLDFRAYDTLLESAVLMVAAVVVLAIGRDDGFSQAPRHGPEPPATLRWVAALTAPLLLLFGLWLLFAGSSGPGGAFQAGAVFCALLILMHTAGARMERFTTLWLRPLLVVGVVAFIVAGLAGPLLGEPWLSWPAGWAFAVILAVEILLTAGITVGLFVIYLGLANPLVCRETGPASARCGGGGLDE